jgi:hypothetical protein
VPARGQAVSSMLRTYKTEDKRRSRFPRGGGCAGRCWMYYYGGAESAGVLVGAPFDRTS